MGNWVGFDKETQSLDYQKHFLVDLLFADYNVNNIYLGTGEMFGDVYMLKSVKDSNNTTCLYRYIWNKDISKYEVEEMPISGFDPDKRLPKEYFVKRFADIEVVRMKNDFEISERSVFQKHYWCNKVTCSFFSQPLYTESWDNIIRMMKKFTGFNYNIEGLYYQMSADATRVESLFNEEDEEY